VTRRSGKHRPERLASRIQESIAQAIATLVKDPRVGFVTVTGATVAPDGTHAVIKVSVMGSDEEKQLALAGLESARGFLRSRLARSLTLRTAPDLHFELDRGLEHAAHINRLLSDLKRDEH
jgi:ribosome-binding factor A